MYTHVVSIHVVCVCIDILSHYTQCVYVYTNVVSMYIMCVCIYIRSVIHLFICVAYLNLTVNHSCSFMNTCSFMSGLHVHIRSSEYI